MIVAGFEFGGLDYDDGKYFRPLKRFRLLGKITMNDDGRVTGVYIDEDRTKKGTAPLDYASSQMIGLLIDGKDDQSKASEWVKAAIDKAAKDIKQPIQETTIGGSKITIKSIFDEIRFSIVPAK